MKISKARKMVDKAVSAMAVAVENFNKPAAAYRGETFALLALNSWELILKARVLQKNSNKLSSIYVFEKKKKKVGEGKTNIDVIAKNRTGLPLTISPNKAISILQSMGSLIHPSIVSNIDALLEIRDSSAHFLISSQQMELLITEISAACVSNFVAACKEWFKKDCSHELSILLPLGFFNGSQDVPIGSTNPKEKSLIARISQLQEEAEKKAITLSSGTNYAFTLKIEFKMITNGKNPSAPNIVRAKPGTPDATVIEQKLEDRLIKHSWRYHDLVNAILAKRLIKRDKKFLAAMTKLKNNNQMVLHNFLDPIKKTGQRCSFYSPNALDAFFAIYDSI